jgi:hypothetical protein
MMKQHPAIMRGVTFYEDLHQQMKEKQFEAKKRMKKIPAKSKSANNNYILVE